MKNKILVVLSLTLMIFSVGCTTKNVDQSAPDGDAAELTGDSTGGDAAATAKADSKSGSSELGDDFGSDDQSKASTETAKTGDAAATPPAAGGTDDLAGLDDASATPPMDTTPPPSGDLAATPPAMDDTQGLSGAAAMGSVDTPKPVIPLQKMVSAPYTKGGVLANALYVARPSDTLKSVSQKIYGQDKVAELKKVNPNLAHRKLKVGDKVYYNSPQRPGDNSQMLTYYEDKGLAPEVYLAQSGDSLKAVSKKLLGDSNSWKELWATNLDVESKGDLAEGTRLRYWSNESAPAAPMNEPPPPAQNLAANTPPPPTAAPAQVAPPPMPAEAPQAAPPPPPQAAAMPAEPPPPPQAAAMPAEPPPPPQAAAAVPPPPKKAPKAPGAAADKDAGGLGDDPDQMMALGVGVILLLAAAALVIIIRKKRAKRSIDFQTASHTQIE